MRFLPFLLVPLLLAPVATATGSLTLDLPDSDATTQLCHGRFNVCAVAPEPVRSVLIFLVRLACSQVSCPG